VQDELILLAGVRRLDPEALTEAHDRYYPAIFRYIAYRVGNQETAEDLTSEVFVRLLDAVRDHHAPQNTLRGWLYAVAARVVADHHRKHYRGGQEVALTETLESDVKGPAEETIKKQTLEALHEALGELTEEQQDVIALRFAYEMPIKEVAMVIGKSEGAVKQLQARAVAALSRRMTGGKVSP
jgi:RNA polymerase sigma-70 factor (ECF subfamily)